MSARLERWWRVCLLGLATIGAYGTAYYSIGVLIPVIGSETGWSTGTLSSGFSLGVLGQGGVALLAGRTLDRSGSARLLLPAIAIGASFLLLASLAQEAWQFVVAWAAGGAIIGGGLYYNVTMPMTARLYPDRRAAAFSVLTLLGALASPIFYPIAGWLLEAWGWRGALQALVGLMVLSVLPAALFVRAPSGPGAKTGQPASGLRAALREPVIHRALLIFALAGMANSALLLHQVPAMQAAGLSLAAASGFAGLRGAFQIPGRLFLTPLTARVSLRGVIGACYALATTAAVALFIALEGHGATIAVAYFAVIGGMSLGLLSPLNGLFQAEVYGDERLGTLSGVGVIVGSIASASGAWLSGLAIDLTDSYQTSLAGVVVLQGLAVAALVWQAAAMRDREGSRSRAAPLPTGDAAG